MIKEFSSAGHSHIFLCEHN
uniref:Uncharacterized protein n=1 Tax=Rhizophora mucronata TaxID=61149 RepID=A0A2P2N7N7_RHIMU